MLRVVLVGMIVVILLLAAFGALSYRSSETRGAEINQLNSTLRSEGALVSGLRSQISQLNATLGSKDALVSGLRANLTTVDAEIATLTGEIVRLQSSGTANMTQMRELQANATRLEAASAFVNLELTQVEAAFYYASNGLYIADYSLNGTVSILPNSTMLLEDTPVLTNGSVSFFSDEGCSNEGVGGINGTHGFNILLVGSNSTLKTSPGSFSFSDGIVAGPLVIEFTNVSQQYPAVCNFSLYILQQSSTPVPPVA